MSAGTTPPGAAIGAECAEVRKASIHAGQRAEPMCGECAEEVRKHSDLAPLPALPWCSRLASCQGRGAPELTGQSPNDRRHRGDLAPGRHLDPPALKAARSLTARETPPEPPPDQWLAPVLTHPAFDRPPVHNERKRGRKAGTVSLSAARRRAFAVRAQYAPTGTLAPHLESLAGSKVRREENPGTPARQRWPNDDAPRGMTSAELGLIDGALAVLGRHLRQPGAAVTSPELARRLVRLHLAAAERERFGVLFLDSQHRVIAFEVLFAGTLAQVSVYPREIARRALQLNAGAVILAHNHPSGHPEPSRADVDMTRGVQRVLGALEVAVLDHLVIGGDHVVSFAERGLM